MKEHEHVCKKEKKERKKKEIVVGLGNLSPPSGPKIITEPMYSPRPGKQFIQK
jgi:hypothetical protein